MQVEVEISHKKAIYVNGSRITDRSTKWGQHVMADTFRCSRDEVVKTCVERGHREAVERIDEDFYLKQKVEA